MACDSDILVQLEGPLDETGQLGDPQGEGGEGGVTDINVAECTQTYTADVSIGFGQPAPDIGDACRITGTLGIGAEATEDEVDALSEVVAVDKDLLVTKVVDGSILSGLSKITQVNRSVSIIGNPGITDLDFLGNLRSSGALVIKNNQALTDLSGIATVGTIRGSFVIQSVPATTLRMNRISGMGIHTVEIGPTGLTTVEMESLSTCTGFKLEFNQALETARFPQLNSVTGPLTVRKNPQLSTLDLSGLGSVSGVPTLCEVDQATVDAVAMQIGQTIQTVCQ